MSNPFDLLGNDIEDPNQEVIVPRELVKKSTSSKKADVPPPSANPARSKGPRAKPAGNDGALKDKNAGRQNNRSRNVSSNATAKRDNTRKQTDRHSRTGRTDSDKKLRQTWGDDNKELDDETAASADVAAEIQEEEEETANTSNQMTLDQYLQGQESTEDSSAEVTRKVDAIEGAELFVKPEEEYVPATKVKTIKSKQLKTKQFLDFDASFNDNTQKPKRSFDRNNNNNNGRRGGNRSPRKNNNSGKKVNGNAVQRDSSIDTKNLPSLA